MVELQIVILAVAGSSPVGHPTSPILSQKPLIPRFRLPRLLLLLLPSAYYFAPNPNSTVGIV